MIRLGITLEDDQGLESNVCAHFGQCTYFGLVELDGPKIQSSKVVPNTAQHGGGGCQAVDVILSHGITHVIAGGMGGGAQAKFAQAGIPVYGYSGKAQHAVEDFIKKNLGGLASCADHDGHCH
ncbi:MAG: NifB/NifX family molybdenum-iron cluster-binding protein [Candidatus Omnitrophota bacterium]